MPLMVCPKCRKPFAGSAALGGGWIGMHKVVGCPRCHTFFARLPYMDLLLVIFGLVNVLLAGPLMLYQGVLQDSNGKLWNGLLAVGIGSFLVLSNRYLVRKNVRKDEPIYVPPWERRS
jgi:hypothetical protein